MDLCLCLDVCAVSLKVIWPDGTDGTVKIAICMSHLSVERLYYYTKLYYILFLVIIIYFINSISCFRCSTGEKRYRILKSSLHTFFMQFNVSCLSQSSDWWFSLSCLSHLPVLSNLSLNWQMGQVDGWFSLSRLSRHVLGRPNRNENSVSAGGVKQEIGKWNLGSVTLSDAIFNLAASYTITF